MPFEMSDDYVDVAARIREFREKFPEGSLRPVNPEKPYDVVTVGEKTFIVYSAAAYRTPHDVYPGIGVAWEPFPGKTPFTRDSELMNAETSAWGRAIVATLAADTNKVATRDDVERRRAEQDAPPAAVDVPSFGLSLLLSALRGCQVKQDARNVHAVAKTWGLLGEAINGDGIKLAEIITHAGHTLPETIEADPDDRPPVAEYGDRAQAVTVDLPEEDTRPAVLVDTEHARQMRAEAVESWREETNPDVPEGDQ